ncbi:MAG: pseudouridine-5'-phosphate glycosidase [Thermogemmatispora sp.]|uniref:pseudouridine-5'-phosphate glycosidase n=1 Tax=Thermogemmatispora sp. TaxID=1968838 RepID=UPI00260F72CB|nr:pseudouridine-5'-phosphate glycosidase [Thermogemmatispora sp.]MBX5456097.1 pseudouridine-5'-phosphate glycosidase [Thermogemmatispora sp.]
MPFSASAAAADRYLWLAPTVRDALAEGRPLVALESTVIAHGLPYPTNIETALAMEEAVREEGAVPATIAIRAGRIMVGLDRAALEELATAQDVLKVSRRDLAFALASRRLGATTVAGTMLCAHLAGIRFFATGGIGGVHRGGESTLDISADLMELSRTPVLVVCAGAKAILDLPRTLEYLETQGVPVLGWQTDEFPAFYTPRSGLRLQQRVDDEVQAATIARTHWECGLAGLLVCSPVPVEAALPAEQVEAAIAAALARAEAQGISGAALTPFLLRRVAETTGGASLRANCALLVNNARVAARIARAYCAVSGRS